MNILNAQSTDLSAALSALSAKLGSGAGMVSQAGMEKTVAVFGKPLTPAEVVRTLIAAVRERGDDAIAEYLLKLDGARLTPEQFRLSPDALRDAWDQTPEPVRSALQRARENIRRFQEHIRPQLPSTQRNAEGGFVGITHRPLNRVGLYIPAGLASTVLMTAVPASVAGVREIALATPCNREGMPSREVLAAAHVAGVTEVYRIGGALAIAAFACGTSAVPRVEKICGPGNTFVTIAKKELYGEVDLDMLAGPSEVLVIADAKAEPRFIAADMLSQAEHNPAAAVLLTPEEKIARRTLEALEAQLPRLSRAQAARDCLERYGFIGVTRDLDHAVELANQFAPEHLELAVAKPDVLLPRIRTAGAVFMGQFTPEPVGDYVAGPSHVLPTGGTARFFSGLGVYHFMRTMSVIHYDRDALRKTAADVDVLARAEGLDAHARSATIRFE